MKPELSLNYQFTFFRKSLFIILILSLLVFYRIRSVYFVNYAGILMIKQLGQLESNFFDVFTSGDVPGSECLRVDLSKLETNHNMNIGQFIQQVGVTNSQLQRLMAYVALYDGAHQAVRQNDSEYLLPITRLAIALKSVSREQCIDLISEMGDIPQIEKFLVTGGEYFQTVGKILLSRSFYQAALTLDGSNMKVLDSLLFLYSQSGNSTGEIEILNHYLALDMVAHDSQYYMRLAYLEELKGNWQDAIQAYEEACGLGELASICRYRIARLYHYQLLDIEKAQKEYETILEVEPTYEAAWQGLNFVLVEQGDFERASDLLEQMRLVVPTSEAPSLYAGWNELKRSRPLEAIPYLLDAIETNPTNALVFNILGRAYRDAGILDKAASAFEEQVRLDPLSSQGMAELAEVNLLRGEAQTACEWVVKSLEINPNNELAKQISEEMSEC